MADHLLNFHLVWEKEIKQTKNRHSACKEIYEYYDKSKKKIESVKRWDRKIPLTFDILR